MRNHLGGLCAVLLAGAASAQDIGVAQASGYYKQDTRPTLYQPLNLLDGRDNTAWCTRGPDPLNDQLAFGFSGPVTVDELRITSGNNFDDATFKDFARARKFSLRSGKEVRTFSVEDQRGPQTITLDKPLTGSRFSVEVLDQHHSDDPDAPACITDFIFVAAGKPLSGPWLTRKLKFDRNASPLIGVWFGGYQGTPDHFLHLNFDGTFRYSYEPFDTQRNAPKELKGTWDAGGARLTFEVGKKRYAVKVAVDPAPKTGQLLKLDGELPPELKQAFRSAP